MPGASSLSSWSPVNLKTVDPNRAFKDQRTDEYPRQTWFFLASFIGLLTLFRVGELIVHWRRKRAGGPFSSPQTNAEKTTVNENKNVSLRRIPLALLNYFRILAYRITLPIGGGKTLNLAELGITFGYIIALFTWEFINCMNVTTKVKLDIDYWSDRTANIVAIQLPLIVALAGKNNIISFLTGISYEKLSILHRVAARICVILVWVHFWGRVKQGLVGHDDTLTNPAVRTGVMIGIAYTLLVVISFRPLRTKFYEVFFFSHFVLVLILLIGAYFHLQRGTGFGPYLIPSFIFWALDRTLRGLRVLWNNRSRTPSSRLSFSSEATAELVSPTMVRLVLQRKMSWRAGQNAFITMPGISRIPFEAHPFTIASIPRCRPESSDNDIEKGAELNEGNELVFLIGVKEGLTRRLRETAEQKGGDNVVFPVSAYVDGPYGSPPDVNAFGNVILVAGGSGVSYTLPLLQDIVQNARQGKTVCSSVFFLWAIPHHTGISWISRALNEVMEAAPQSLKLRLRIDVTQGAYTEGDTNSGDSTSDTKEDVDSFRDRLLADKRVNVQTGRPNVGCLLEEELTGSRGHVSVVVAGPAGLAADVRKALRFDLAGPKTVLRGSPDVTLHVETYGIA